MQNQLIHRVVSRSRSWLLRNIVLPAGDAVTHQGMMQRLRFLEKAQWWPQDRILSWQKERLRELMRTAAEVPFYRELMDASHLSWQDVREPTDLRRLPWVTKEMMRAAYPERITRETGFRCYEARTSGSTGLNFEVQEDAATAGQYRAAFLLALRWAGWDFGEAHMQTGMTYNRQGMRSFKDSMLRCHYVSAAALTDADLDTNLGRLEKDRIQHLWGYPGSLYVLAQRAEQQGWNLPLRSVVTWGDNLFPHYREVIERVFRTPVFDTYGCAEGFQVAAQCGKGKQYHLQSFDVITEFLDEQGDPVKPGEGGHLIVTRLYPGPMPLIRYKVGDMAVTSERPLCDCGRGMPLMESIQGRDTDVIVTPSGNRLIVHFFTGVLEFFPEIRNFQIVQEEIESMTIRLVPSTRNALDESAQRRIVSAYGIEATGIAINLEIVDEIPAPPTGKRRFVISKLPKTHLPLKEVNA